MTLSLVFAAVGLPITAGVAVRERARVIATRRRLLDRCSRVLSDVRITHGGDGFPMAEGYHGGRFVRLELVPDTMTIRRLPQLWLKLTRLEARPGVPEFSMLVRPNGSEFYSLTSEHPVMLTPPSFRADTIAKGDRKSSQFTLDACSPGLRQLFADQRTKEVAVTRKGLRLVWQVAEGHRGEHLLFRQCRFETDGLDPADLLRLLSGLDEVGAQLDPQDDVRAA